MPPAHDTFRLHVPSTYGDGQPASGALLHVIEQRLRVDFVDVDQVPCDMNRPCTVFAISAHDRSQVFASARSIARLLLQPAAWIGLPNGHVTVLNVDVDGFFV